MTKKEIWDNISIHHSRLLSQLDRDVNSPTFGSFDRNFWNYKIRDFSSSILQQGVIYLDILFSFEHGSNSFYKNKILKTWIRGSIDFWCKSQLKNGSFNEYYPNESGFPPTAFSLYAISNIIKKYPEFVSDNVVFCINKAIKWLLKTPENDAMNQESAALAGIIIASKIKGVLFDENKLDERLSCFYKSQSPEGWFNEYGGADLGYLSVTIDSLWDMYSVSKDNRALAALEKATNFIYNFISISEHTPIMINSRNTDYLVPYGLSGFASINKKAKEVSYLIIKSITKFDSVYHKTDDRYLTHYIGQSYMRSLMNFENFSSIKTLSFNLKKLDLFYTDCGVFIKHIPNNKSIYVAAKKGGVINVYTRKKLSFVDYGWCYLEYNNEVSTTHWQNQNYKILYRDNKLTIEGNFTTQKFIRPSTLGHVFLRLFSLFMGNELIPYLKNRIIFSNKVSKAYFNRRLIIINDKIKIDDSFKNINKEKLIKAQKYSMRHVSSANRFSFEEII